MQKARYLRMVGGEEGKERDEMVWYGLPCWVVYCIYS